LEVSPVAGRPEEPAMPDAPGGGVVSWTGDPLVRSLQPAPQPPPAVSAKAPTKAMSAATANKASRGPLRPGRDGTSLAARTNRDR
jgi:hypothetical protein